MARHTDFPMLPRLTRVAFAAASSALLLSACTTDQQATTARPAVRADDELGSLIRVAAMTRQAGDLDTAAALYRRAHEVDPRNPQPLIELAQILDDNGSPADAALLWQDALRLAPNDPTVLGGYGVTLARLGQPEQAEGYLDKATKATPTAQIWNALGIVRDQLGDANGAQAAYRSGLAMAPADIRLANNLGLSLALAGRHDEALELLERIVVRPDATFRHRQNLALAYALAGQDALAARVGGIDADPALAHRNVMQYASIATLPDHASRVAAVSTLRAAEATNQANAAAETAALVDARRNAPQTAEKPANDRVTPVVAATRLAPTAPALPPAVFAKTDDRPAADTAAGVPETAQEPMPVKAAAVPAKPTHTTAVAPAIPATVADRPQPLPAASPADKAQVADAQSAPDAFDPVTQLNMYRPAFTAAPADEPTEVAAADGFDPTTLPQTYKPALGAPVENVPAVVPATEVVLQDAPAATIAPSAEPSVSQLMMASVAKPETQEAAPFEEAAPVTQVTAEAPVAEMKAAGPSSAGPADSAGMVETAEPAPAAWPLALAGIAVPSIEDRLIVAASAYHAGEYDFAAAMWQPLADAGVVRAKFHLGALYYEGRGVERDLGTAYRMLREAELAGFTDARIILALVEAKLPDDQRRQVEAQVAAARP